MRGTLPSLALAVAVGLTALTLAGCAGESTVDGYVGDTSVVPEAEMAAEAPRQDIAPQVIRTANVYLEVDSVDAAATEIKNATTAVDGSIDSENITRGDDWTSANFTLRIPEQALDSFLSTLEQVGDVQSMDVNSQDVTLEVVDLEARISTLEGSIDRLRELQQQATSVADLVAVESELANRQSELESLTARREYLSNQVSLSTVYVSLSEIEVGPSLTPDFLGGLQSGWDTLLTLGAGLITALGFITPTAILVALVLIIIVGIIRRRRKTKEKAS